MILEEVFYFVLLNENMKHVLLGETTKRNAYI